jgi:DNA replication protein DnaC
MDTQDFSRSKALNNVPSRKLQLAIDAVNSESIDLVAKATKLSAINRYSESNIPIEYWYLKMERDFTGDPRLLAKYTEYVADLKAVYVGGTSICFAGKHGVGKSMTITCILKKAVLKGFSCLYTTASDIVNVLVQGSNDDKYLARRELAMVDFLAIDELDIRFFNQSDLSNELFGRSLEPILRSRLQNKLPILIGTNSPNIKESFTSMFKASLDSLMSKIEDFSVMPGKDFRKEKSSMTLARGTIINTLPEIIKGTENE